MLACVLGSLWGIHLMLAAALLLYQNSILIVAPTAPPAMSWLHLNQTLGEDRVQMLCQWCVYVVLVCTFHLLEFFTTAIYNPLVATADSFLVNHSMGYTAALLSSTCEFWLRFWFWPSFCQSLTVCLVGLSMVILAQILRSLAMATCAASFNHKIQTTKKDNHMLVTHGMYV